MKTSFGCAQTLSDYIISVHSKLQARQELPSVLRREGTSEVLVDVVKSLKISFTPHHCNWKSDLKQSSSVQ